MITKDELGAILTIDEIKLLRRFILDHYESLNQKSGLLTVYRQMRDDEIFELYSGFKDIIANLGPPCTTH